MNWWIITDTHLGHNKMMEYCGRPSGFENKILRQISHKTKPGDVLIHLGDVCIYRDEYWNKKLIEANNGKSWLVKGNHDKKSNSWYLGHGWDFVADSILMTMFGLSILLTHKPTLHHQSDVNVHGHWHHNGHHPEDKTDERNILFFIEHKYSPELLRKIVNK